MHLGSGSDACGSAELVVVAPSPPADLLGVTCTVVETDAVLPGTAGGDLRSSPGLEQL